MRRYISCLFALAAMSLPTGARPASEQAPLVLDKVMFSRMDSDSDMKVSKEEYFSFGEAYMEKRGKPFDQTIAALNFSAFDQNGNGWIEPDDAHALSAYDEALLAKAREQEQEKIVGVWQYWHERKYRFITFVFTKDGEADLINHGVSTRSLAQRHGGSVTYTYDPSATPATLDIIAAGGSGPPNMICCIVELMPNDRLRMRMAHGQGTVERPTVFPEKDGKDTLTLRGMKSDPTGMKHF